MRRGITLIWVGAVLPFGLTILNGGPAGYLPHVLFHPTYITFLVVAIVGAVQLVRSQANRWVRWPAALLVVAALVAIAGHASEELVVIREGGFAVTPEVFSHPDHVASANFALPATLVALTLTVVVSLGAFYTGTSARSAERWTRVVHRWLSLALIPGVVVSLASPTLSWLAIVPLVLLIATGLQMNGRYYLTRLRRLRRREAVSLAAAPTTHAVDA